MTENHPEPMRLGIDLDGVVADFNAGWIGLYNAEFGADLSVDQVVMWNAPVLLTHFGSMSQFWRWASTAAAGSSIFRVLDPFDGALPTLHRLAVHHTIVIVTTKPRFAIDDTHAWLAEHRVPSEEIHIVDDKAEVDCDVYLDDADHNLERLVAARPGATVVRFERPWNSPRADVLDVGDWESFEHLVRRMSVG